MRTKTATFFECKVRYEKTMETGELKKVTETYVVDALSFTEAEGRVIEEMRPYVGDNEMEVTAIKISSYKKLFFSECEADEKYYKVRCNFITIDEKNGKERKTFADYLVQASSVDEARKTIEEAMSVMLIDYVIGSIVETNIMDVFEYKSSNDKK